MSEQIKKYLQLFESRIPDVEYKQTTKEVVATLKSYKSATYTNLAKKVERLSLLEAEVKQLKEEVKEETREHIAGIFDASDAIHTRVVETVSFILTLSKDPAETRTPKYKDILSELEKHMTPELIAITEQLKSQLVTVVQKQPSLRVKSKLSENVEAPDSVFLQHVERWAEKYDQRLDNLQSQV